MIAADPIAKGLAEFVHGLRLQDIPPVVSLRARHLMLDAIGCGLAARGEGFSARFWAAATALADGVEGQSGVLGYARRLPLRDAALLNGVLMHGLDFDDTHIAGIVHLTVAVLPALLSVAARRDASGEQLLVAYVAGMEAGTRIAMAAHGGFHKQGFHPTGVIGAFAAACAVGRLLELTPEQLVHAQGAALSMAAGNLQFLEDGAWTKRLHAGWAAQTGITAAMLAAAGVVAPTAPYAGRYGLYHAYLDEAGRSGVDLSLATASLPGGEGEPVWELLNIAVKPFAMCHFVHAAADAAIALHRQGVVVEHIREVTVLVPETAVAIVCEPLAQKRQPQTDYDAKFSLPYAVACGLIRGKLGLKELEPEALQAASVKALMVRVSYAVDPDTTFPRHYSGEVRITLYDGTQLSHRESVNRGHPDSPLINQEVQDKFMDNACLHFSSEHARAVVGQVLSLERLPSARTLEDLLSQEPTRPS